MTVKQLIFRLLFLLLIAVVIGVLGSVVTNAVLRPYEVQMVSSQMEAVDGSVTMMQLFISIVPVIKYLFYIVLLLIGIKATTKFIKGVMNEK